MPTDSKEGLLKQCDSLRDKARQARRLAANLTREDDRAPLLNQARALDEQADRLEKAAIDARTGVFAGAKDKLVK